MRSRSVLVFLLVATGCSAIAHDPTDTAASDLVTTEERRLVAEMAASYNDSWRFRALSSNGCMNVVGAALAVPPSKATAHLEAFWERFHRRPADLPMGLGEWGCDALAATIPYLAVGYADPLFKGAFPPKTPALPVASGSPVSIAVLEAFLSERGLAAIRPDVLLYVFHLRDVSDANRTRWMSLPECTRIDFGMRQAFRGLEPPPDANAVTLGLEKRYASDRLRSLTTITESPTWLPDDVNAFLRRCPQTAPAGSAIRDEFGEIDSLYFHQLATYAPGLGFRSVEGFTAVAARTDVPSPPIELWAEALNPRSSLGATVRVLSQLLTEAERGPVAVYGTIPYKRYGGDVDRSADYGPNVGIGYRFDASDVRAAMTAMLTDDTASEGSANLRRSIVIHPIDAAGHDAYLSFETILSDDVVQPGSPANGLLTRPLLSIVSQSGAPLRPIASRRSVLSRRYVLEGGAPSTSLDVRYAALPPRLLAPASSVDAAVNAYPLRDPRRDRVLAWVDAHGRWAKRATRQEWARRIDAWRQSGESAAAFAGRHGWNPRTLAWWSSRGLRAKPATAAEVRFVEVAPGRGTAKPSGVIDVVLRNGRRLRVRGRVDVEALAALARALEA